MGGGWMGGGTRFVQSIALQRVNCKLILWFHSPFEIYTYIFQLMFNYNTHTHARALSSSDCCDLKHISCWNRMMMATKAFHEMFCSQRFLAKLNWKENSVCCIDFEPKCVRFRAEYDCVTWAKLCTALAHQLSLCVRTFRFFYSP